MTWQEQINQVVKDNLSGALTITAGAANALIDFSTQTEFSSVDDLASQIIVIGEQVLQSQTGMAPLANLLNRIVYAIHSEGEIDDAVPALQETVQTFLSEQSRATTELSRRGLALMPSGLTVCTHSASSTVLEAIKLAGRSGRNPQVICHESRPGLEGRLLAKDLAEAGIPVTLTVDAAMFSNVRKSEIVLVGADALSENGIIAKVGTASLATCAKWLGVPCYVLADTQKIWPYELGIQPIKSHDPTEIWQEAATNVAIDNRYYDLTSWDAVSGVVTEQGLLTGTEIRQLSRERPAHPVIYQIIDRIRSSN